ncbi:MAG TPA: hypothetical protein VN634_10905 [Candidatus Limnocylindrales bacterium]|nr:hypothetical protein [Candidatus Limnocylindrales bacterium]
MEDFRCGALLRVASAVALAVMLCFPATAAAVDYDIVYVRQPRYGDHTNTIWPEVFHPARIDPGADLMLLHPDGSEELLVEGGNGAVTDPFVSFDAEWVYYSYFPDVRAAAINNQRGLPYAGSDIYRIHLQSRTIEQLTHGEFTPNTGAAHWYRDPGGNYQPVDTPNQYEWDHLGYGILNLGPAPIAGGRIVFASNRNGFLPPKGYTNPSLQLYVMDADGRNVREIAPMNISSALHPTPLVDGRVVFSSHESQGIRDTRLWGLWSIDPDGRHWGPVVSAFHDAQAFHFVTQLSNTDLVLVDYYNLNNNGFGALYRMPISPPPGQPPFYSAFVDENPSIDQTVGAGFHYPFRMPFTPRGMYSITPFTTGQDEAAPVGTSGVRVGKFTHPSAAPAGDLLVVWTPGPANDLNRPSPEPYYDAGLYVIPGGDIVTSPSGLVLIKNDPAFNEAWPRAVVPYSAVHGVSEPAELPWLPNDGSEHPGELPAGTPFGLVGTSSVYKRESFPGYATSGSESYDGLDVFNTAENGQSTNWVTQGAEDGYYGNDDIWAIRLLAMEPGTHRSYGPNGGPSGGQLFSSHAMERLRILGEIPLRKTAPGGGVLLDPEGNPDTSFLAKIPADTPFTFQLLDRNGLSLTMAQTWHQVRPGESRYDCGGCHAHSSQPLDFEQTAADQPGYPVYDLSEITPLVSHDGSGNPSLRTVASGVVDVEFYRDIRPLLQRSCVACHSRLNASPGGDLVLDDYTDYGGVPGDYARLADDRDATWGYAPVIGYGWRQTNASRYIRSFQSRRSLLVWKIFGQRLDGWTNADHPTETVPGVASTLPSGASTNLADLDYTGTIMPPAGSGVPALTIDEKMTIARWIDLGCPINNGDGGATAYGWFLDEIRPTLEVSVPREGRSMDNLTELVIGIADANSGIEPGSLSVVANFALAGRGAGAELADLATGIGEGIWRIALGAPAAVPEDGEIRFEVRDRQGNTTWVTRQRSAAPFVPPPPFACDAAPRTGCRETLDAKLSMRLSDPLRKSLTWKWKSGDATDFSDLGHPLSTTSHTLCLYADNGSGPALVADLGIAPGAYWSARGTTGFQYKDKQARADGVTKIKIAAKSGERGAVMVKAAGASVPLAAADVPEGAVLTTQWVNSDLQCWEGR